MTLKDKLKTPTFKTESLFTNFGLFDLFFRAVLAFVHFSVTLMLFIQ